MQEMDNFDFWYAVNNTEVLRGPSQHLEAFGATDITYHLITELMDEVDKVRVREGRIEAARPQIITPGNMGSADLEGFSDGEAEKYVSWLREHAQHLRILQYGFKISKQEVNDYILSDPPALVAENVLAQVEQANNPFSAVVRGVDQPWEVCLIKLMVELVESSAAGHVQSFQERNLIPRGPDAQQREIDDEFLAASRDPARIPYLHKVLNQRGLFREYEDRFYALVRASQG